MVTDNQVKQLRRYLQQGKTLDLAAAKSGMDPKTARKYRDHCKLPSELRAEQIRTWRTRDDPFARRWPEVEGIKCLVIGNTKNYRPHYVPVTERIQEILDKAQNADVWVFPSPQRPESYIKDVRPTLKRL